MEKKSIKFSSNKPFGEVCYVDVFRNEGMFNDIEKALTLYYETFGITDGLERLLSVYFKNGYYEFFFLPTNSTYKGWEHLVRFILSIDWDSPFGIAQVGDERYDVRSANFEKSTSPMSRLYCNQ